MLRWQIGVVLMKHIQHRQPHFIRHGIQPTEQKDTDKIL